MSSPMKPWESGTGEQNRVLQSSSNMQNVLNTPVGRMRVAPPIPPRPNGTTVSYNNGYNANSYGNVYNRGLGYSPYNSYGSYGGLGSYGGYSSGYGMPMGGYGYGNNYGAESRFIQLAEESTRPAFESIESIVRAFSGISMMMDSTFFAITSSFRAVLGIAENFGRLRSMFGQIWSSFALFRFLRWVYRKVLGTVGIHVASDVGSKAWEQAIEGTVSESCPKGANWPILVFIGIIVSAPYLISKIIPSVPDHRDPSKWPSKGVPAKVMYEYQATSPQELSVTPGETIMLAPLSIQEEMQLMETGWVFGSNKRNSGLVPKNYVQLPIQNGSQTTSASSQINNLSARNFPNTNLSTPSTSTQQDPVSESINDS